MMTAATRQMRTKPAPLPAITLEVPALSWLSQHYLYQPRVLLGRMMRPTLWRFPEMVHKLTW